MSGCGCVYVDYDNGPEFMCESIHKARKLHRCGECRRDIRPGELYEHVVGKWDGDFAAVKTCADCQSIRKAFFCGAWTYGDIMEDLQESLRYEDDLGLCCLDGLTPAARETVMDILRDGEGAAK